MLAPYGLNRNLYVAGHPSSEPGERNKTERDPTMPDIIQGLILTADPSCATEIREHAAASHPRLFLRSVQELSDESELDSLVRIYSPSLLFLDMDDTELAEYVCSVVRGRIPHAQIIGFARDLSKEALLTALRYGLRDVLQCPLTAGNINSAIQRAIEQLEASGHGSGSNNRNQIFCFLPAKAGSGASTLAIHSAAALSKIAQDGRKAALLDLDFECGVVDFLLNEPYEQGVKHLLAFADNLDEGVWKRAVQSAGNLDVVRTGSQGRPVKASAQQIRGLLAYARANYDYTCLDLPEQLNEAATTALEFCDAVLLVCTPDLASAHLTRRRLSLLREYGLQRQVKVILNRNQSKSQLGKKEVEELLDTEVFAVIDNDYQGLQNAILRGRLMEKGSSLGKQFSQMAQRLAGIGGKKKQGSLSQDGIWQNLKRLIGLRGASEAASEPAKTRKRQLLLPPPSSDPAGMQASSTTRSSHSIPVLDLSRSSL